MPGTTLQVWDGDCKIHIYMNRSTRNKSTCTCWGRSCQSLGLPLGTHRKPLPYKRNRQPVPTYVLKCPECLSGIVRLCANQIGAKWLLQSMCNFEHEGSASEFAESIFFVFATASCCLVSHPERPKTRPYLLCLLNYARDIFTLMTW